MSEISRRSFLAATSAAALAGGITWSAPPTALAADGARPAPEDGYDTWLRYRPIDDVAERSAYRERLRYLVAEGSGATYDAAVAEVLRGLGGMLGQQPTRRDRPAAPGALVLGTAASPFVRDLVPAADLAATGTEGYLLRTVRNRGIRCVVVAASTDVGVLHGVFHLLRLVQTRAGLDSLDLLERPASPLRMINHWDNLNRTVERGYAGGSIYDWEALPALSPRYTDYARMLASLGLNAVAVNNVNASSTFLTPAFLPKLVALAGVFRTYGVQLFVSANFASPQNTGGLPTSDPLDPAVQQWWKNTARDIYAAIPDFGGWLVKASSEGQPGPITYGRTHAEGANTLAAAVAPYGGIVIYRAFVHGEPAGWTEDAWNEFHPIDGDFADNTLVQIKNGPMDFNVREPVHPLLGGLPRTSAMIELQITQEYTGHSTHLCYLVPQWKEVLDFDTRWSGTGPLVRDLVDGFAGVINVGDDRNWTGHHLAAANTHGYGRLAWDPTLSAAELAREWTTLTFGPDKQLVDAVSELLLSSWATYEDYVAILGQGYLMHGLGDHFGPDLPATTAWHRANAVGIGFDRTVATGSGYAGFYSPAVAAPYEDPATTPEDLLLFFHHLPYTHRLPSGNTVLQQVYDNHFRGADDATGQRRTWQSLERRIDPRRYAEVDERFAAQVEQAFVWRDAVVGYLFGLSRILDQRRSWLQVAPARTSVLLGGWPNRFPISVGNASAATATGTIGLTGPAGWTGEPAPFELGSREFADVEVGVTPPLEPEVATVSVAVGSPLQVLGGRAQQVVTTPAPGRCVLALDAGTPASPLLTGYARLAPDSAWSADRGYGWVGGAPQSRDRGSLDALRRDFCNDTVPRVLRIAVPAGASRLHLLIGDAGVLARGTTVTVDGTQAGSSGPLAAGTFSWLHVDLDGGAAGRTIDLGLAGVPGEHWHLAALALVDPDAPPKAAAVGDVRVAGPLLGGRDNPVTIPVTSLSPDPVEVTATVTGPAGWTSAPVTATIPAGGTVDLAAAIRPPLAPATTELEITVTSPAGEIAGGRTSLGVIAVPAPDLASYTFDAGTPASPVLTGYTALTPTSAWSEAAGFGWVSGTVIDRDRNRIDVLRRDLVLSQQQTVLRLRLPAGNHRAYLLTGDAFAPGARTTVSIAGAVVADSGPAPIPQGSFRWIDWPLTGGADVDLTLTGSEGDRYWRLACLVVIPA